MKLSEFLEITGKRESDMRTPLAGAEALAAVRRYGCALGYVHEQTPEIALAAVKQNGYALGYVHEQTPEVALAAVKENGCALQFVDLAIFDAEDEAQSTALIGNPISFGPQWEDLLEIGCYVILQLNGDKSVSGKLLAIMPTILKIERIGGDVVLITRNAIVSATPQNS